MKVVILLTLLFLVGCSNALSPCGVKCRNYSTSYVLGYYWRDFYGTVPLDAVPGGLDEEGDVTFIGQVYIKEYELLPGTIYHGCSKISTSAYDKDIIADKNIKILCSSALHKLKWKLVNKNELNQLTNTHLVIGGSEIGLFINIGRIAYNGQTIIGKVLQNDPNNNGLAIPGTNTRFSNFEILTYNP
ncbi:hypothetical protein RN001_010371 [Aquatica leii]|uniref:Uncharacterized protein n=1 Tax=Aquatica leii TaxID=1421715 RepID=A0AAN7Q378_9COLE|nr:hypothetical protein RN001_010371 [Aquatica leii]